MDEVDDKKYMTISLTFQNDEKSLTKEEIALEMAKIINALEAENIQIRK